MARRATYFKLKKSPTVLTIGGGYELAPWDAKTGIQISPMRDLKKAYELLDYDIFVLSPSDSTFLKRAGVKPLPSWHRALVKPEVLIRQVPDGLLVFVLFPDMGFDNQAATDKLARITESLRKSARYNLIIGISTWGWAREKTFLETYPDAVDVLLGSGDGPGYSGIYVNNNATLWVRAFSKGKSLQSITFPSLPKPNRHIQWRPRESVFTAMILLGRETASDMQIQAIFGPY